MLFLLLFVKLCHLQTIHYGLWFQYQPFSNFKKVGNLILNENLPFTGQIVMTNYNLTQGLKADNVWIYLSFDLLTLNITVYENGIITQLTQDPKNFEGVWHFLYFEILDIGSKLYIKGISTNIVQISTKNVKPIILQYGEIGKYNFDYFHGNYSNILIFQQQTFENIQQFEQFVTSLGSPFQYDKRVTDIFDGIFTLGETFYSTQMKLYGQKYQVRCWVKLDYKNVIERQRYLLFRLTLNQNYRNDTYLGDRLLLMSYILDPSIDNYNLFNVSVLTYSYPYPQSYVNKNLFLIQNTSNRDRFQKWHFIYFQYLKSKTYLKITYPDNQEIQQTFDVLQFNNQYIYLYVGADTFFYKGYLSGKIWLELTYNYEQEEQYQIQCHYSCQTCDGPTEMDCVTCPLDSNRELKNGYCSCQFGYIDLTQKCNKLNELYPNFKEYNLKNKEKCKYGQFQTQYGCMDCPSQVIDYKLSCVDCLLNSTTWQYLPICTIDYKRNFTNQTFILSQRLESQKEIFYIHQEINSLELCEGCLNYCTDDTKINCIQFNNNYYTCKRQYYKQGNECKKCMDFCSKCTEESICLKCQKYYGFNNKSCVKCPLNCLSCDQNTNCLQCQTGTSLFNGQCYQCGQFCTICEFYYDTLQKNYINRCLKCIDSSLYEISFDALKCQPVTIVKCKYGTQHFLGDLSYTTLDLYFQPLKINSSIIQLCARCESSYTFSNNSYKCYSSTQVCGESSFYSTKGGFQCLIGVDTISIQIIGCEQKLSNCYECLTYLNKVICITCFNGYYGDHIVGTCTKCPSNCNSCGQQLKKNKSFWKQNIRAFYEYIVNLNLTHDFLTYVESINPEDYEIICLTCTDGYEIYNDICIQKCPIDCLSCIIIDGKNVCQNCNYASNGLILSTINNQCYECHNLCQFCVPNDDTTITQFSNKCLRPALENIYFDQDIYQFSLCDDKNYCYQSLNISINLQCEDKTIRVDTIIYEQQVDLSYIFEQIYSDSLFNYMNTKNVQLLNIHIKTQQCMFPENLAISQLFSQNVYTLKTVSLNFEGQNLNTQITFQGNFYIKNFQSLTMKNIHVNLPQQIIGMMFDQSETSILFENVIFYQGSFYFSYKELLSFQIIKTTFDGCQFNNINSIIKINTISPQIFEIREVIFQNVKIENSTLFKLFNIQKIIITQLILKDSYFYNSCLFDIEQVASIDTFKLQWSQFDKSTTIKGIDLTLNNFYILGNTYQSSTYFIDTLNLNLQNSIFESNYLAQYSILIDVQSKTLIEYQILFQNVSILSILSYQECYIINIECNCQVIYENITGLFQFQEFDLNVAIYIQSQSFKILNSQILTQSQISPIFEFDGLKSLIIEDLTLSQEYYLPELSFSQDCLTSYTIQQSLFAIINVQEVKFKNFISRNIFTYNQPIIKIYYTTNSENNIVYFQDCQFSNSLLIKTTNNVTVALLHIDSKNDIQVNINNITFLNNIYKEYFGVNTLGSSSTTIYFSIPQGEVNLISSIFQNNTIIDSINSNIFIQAQNVVIQNCIFKNQNQINLLFSQVLNQYYESIIYKEQFENDINIQSYGGVMQIQSERIIINQTSFDTQNGYKGGCLYIVTLNLGIIQIINSQFFNSQAILGQSESSGGSLLIDGKGSQIYLLIQNCIIKNSQSYDRGGFLHLIVSDRANILMENLIFQDCHSFLSSILQIEINGNLQEQYNLKINQCRFYNTKDGLFEFLNQISQKLQLYGIQSDFLNSVLFKFEQGQIDISNSRFYNIDGYSLFIFSASSSINIQQINVMEMNTELRPLILIDSPLGEIIFINCNFNQINFNYNKKLCNFQINEIITPKKHCDFAQKSLDYFSLNSYPFNCKSQFEVSTNYTNYNVLKINSAQNLILLNNIQFSNINCQGGAIIEIQSSSQILIQNSRFIKLNSSLSVFNFSSMQSRRILFSYAEDLLNTELKIILRNSLFINNVGVNGSSVYAEGVNLSIYDVTFQNNSAENGGTIFLENSKIELTNTAILDNNASFAGVINSNKQIYVSDDRENIILGNYDRSLSGSIQSLPKQIQVSLDSIVTFNNKVLEQKDDKFIEEVSEELILPNYVEIQNYQILKEQFINHGIGNQLQYYSFYQEYNKLNYKLRLIPINQYNQRQFNLYNSQCKITSRLQNQKDFVFSNDFLSLNKITFNTITQDYNLDNLRILTNESLQIKITCDVIKLPIFDTSHQHITGFHNNYILYMNVSSFSCQKGEIIIEYQCVECLTQTYSLTTPNFKCTIANQEVIENNTPSNLKIKVNNWRPYDDNDEVAHCFRAPDKCLGGWTVGPDSCIQGSFGALCETCDIYNIRGSGSYYESYLNCFQCATSNLGYLSLLIVGLWTLITMIVSVNSSLETLKLELLRTKLIAGGLKAYAEHQESSSLYKMFFHYLQIISTLTTFQLEFPNMISIAINSVGSPTQSLENSIDCFLINFQLDILHSRIIWIIIAPILYLAIIFFSYLFLLMTRQQRYKQSVTSIILCHTFLNMQPSMIGILVSILGFRQISGYNWVSGDVSYRYNLNLYFSAILSLPSLAFLALITPSFLFYKLYSKRQNLNSVKQTWGYLYFEFNQRAYFWELVRLAVKNLVIISLTLFDQYIIFKAALVFLILQCYQSLTRIYQPFKTSHLNKLDDLGSTILSISIVLGASSYEMLQTMMKNYIYIFYVIILELNGTFLYKIFNKILLEYQKKNKNKIDNIKFMVIEKFPGFTRLPLCRSLFFQKNNKQIQIKFKRVARLLKESIQSQKKKQVFLDVQQDESIQIHSPENNILKLRDLKNGINCSGSIMLLTDQCLKESKMQSRMQTERQLFQKSLDRYNI